MLHLYPVYLLWNRRKTLTGSPDPTHTNGTNKPCKNNIAENLGQATKNEGVKTDSGGSFSVMRKASNFS